MSTLSIVVITIIAALFSILLLISISLLIYAHIILRRQLSQFSAQFSTLISDWGVKSSQQHSTLQTLIASVHGDQLEKAAKEILHQIPKLSSLAVRMEQATTIFAGLCKEIAGEIEISESSINRARESGLGPDSYATAAPGEHFTSLSATGLSDLHARDLEAADNTESFNE